jgi:hypothetical protein
MSLYAPRTKEQAKFQYCNYGYDKNKYTSFDDCMANYGKVDGVKITPTPLNQGKTFVEGGVVGEPSPTRTEPTPNTDANNILNNKHNTSTYFIIGVAIVIGYLIYKKIKK